MGASRMDLYLDRIWHVGLVQAPIARFLEPAFRPPISWLPRPPCSEFWADPFGVQDGESLWLFAEAYDHGARRGRIVSTRLAHGRWSNPVQAFAPNHHVSYPFLFQDGARLICVPEQWQAGCVALYEVDLRNGQLGPEIARISGFPGVDPVLFQHGEHYWLLATERRAGRADALFAFYASQLEGPYRAHTQNPLLEGQQWVRNAGTPFMEARRLYRPTQDSRKRYGHAIDLTCISTLTPEQFAQQHVARIEPWDARYSLGFHTLSASGAVTLVDGLRPSWVPARWRAWASAPEKPKAL
jgi:hypothetical protein